MARDSSCVALSMDDYEEITDVYKGVKVSWMITKSFPRSNVISWKSSDEEKRAYVLSFCRKNRDIIVGAYLSHVLSEGKTIRKRNRQPRLYTNVNEHDDWGDNEKRMWKYGAFKHSATFDTLGMDPKKKNDIMDDLIAFTKGKDYYNKIGKPWKRGYLLYGPPGTGKSSMISAVANFLHYDVYDLELTAVKDNSTLRKLMLEISKRAIVAIEDIDCSLNVTGKRKTKADVEDDYKKDLKEAFLKKAKQEDESSDNENRSKVTLSGLLNFMDGLWSASAGERIFVLTTNHVEQLDEALIRRGRMDKHIEMSYCCFEAFKVLAMNYLNLDSHEKFDKIRCLLLETDISPAEVTEILMPKSAEMSADECLENLITALLKEKEEAENREAKKQLEAKIEDMENPEKLSNKAFPCTKTKTRRVLTKYLTES